MQRHRIPPAPAFGSHRVITPPSVVPLPSRRPRRVVTPRLARTTEGSGYRAPDNDLVGRLGLHLNENLVVTPRPLSDEALRIDPDALRCYPTQGSRALEHAIASRLQVPTEAIHLGLGASGLLNQIFAAFANCEAVALLPTPTWSYYHALMRAGSITWHEVEMLRRPDAFVYDVDGLVAAAARHTPDLVVLTSPNNPTGSRLRYEDVLRIASTVPSSLVLIDEAYFGFRPEDAISVTSLLQRAPNVMLLRTFSKAWALAGLRVGFAIAGPLGMHLLQRQPVPFGVPAFAQRIAIERLQDPEHLPRLRAATACAFAALAEGLAPEPGFTVLRSAANFALVECTHVPATEARNVLRRYGYEVKGFGPGPLERFLRITLATPEVMARVAQVLRLA